MHHDQTSQDRSEATRACLILHSARWSDYGADGCGDPVLGPIRVRATDRGRDMIRLIMRSHAGLADQALRNPAGLY